MIIAYKPNKDKLKMIYSKLKNALGNKDKVKVNSILESLDSQLMGSSVARLVSSLMERSRTNRFSCTHSFRHEELWATNRVRMRTKRRIKVG